MFTIYASKTDTLLLGRVGENDYTQVIFDETVQAWLAEYPGAVIGLYNRPSRQDQAYPVANIRRAAGADRCDRSTRPPGHSGAARKTGTTRRTGAPGTCVYFRGRRHRADPETDRGGVRKWPW